MEFLLVLLIISIIILNIINLFGKYLDKQQISILNISSIMIYLIFGRLGSKLLKRNNYHNSIIIALIFINWYFFSNVLL